jgi:hypothetical protein
MRFHSISSRIRVELLWVALYSCSTQAQGPAPKLRNFFRRHAEEMEMGPDGFGMALDKL